MLTRHRHAIRGTLDKVRSQLAGIEACEDADDAACAADKVMETISEIDDIIDLYPIPTGYSFVDPLDYLELTWKSPCDHRK